jgi:hypothetical protein
MTAGQFGVFSLDTATILSPIIQKQRQTEADGRQRVSVAAAEPRISEVVRRHAALASAGLRRTTLAEKRARKLKLLKPPERCPPATSIRKQDDDDDDDADPPTGTEMVLHRAPMKEESGDGGTTTPVSLSHMMRPRSLTALLGNDAAAVKDRDLLYSLFQCYVQTYAPRLDNMFPIKGSSWQVELAQVALSSPPCFWSMVLVAASYVGMQGRGLVLTLTFQQMAIRSINRAIGASPAVLHNDFGLMSSIASMAHWEATWGSPAASRLHAEGLKLLHPHFDEKGRRHELYAQTMAFANTLGDGPKLEPYGDLHDAAVVTFEEEAREGMASKAKMVTGRGETRMKKGSSGAACKPRPEKKD